MGNLIIKNPVKCGSCKSGIDELYIEENLRYFIEKEKESYRTSNDMGWFVHEDHKTQLRYLLLEYILENFNLRELYVFFFLQSVYGLCYEIIDDSIGGAIAYINRDSSISTEEAQILTNKISDMNPILYGLIHEFIHQSDLFWDEERQEVVLPDFN